MGCDDGGQRERPQSVQKIRRPRNPSSNRNLQILGGYLTESATTHSNILEESLTELECTAFIEVLHEDYPCTQVLVLQHGNVQPEMLVRACRNIFSAQPGSRTVHVIGELAVKQSA